MLDAVVQYGSLPALFKYCGRIHVKDTYRCIWCGYLCLRTATATLFK